MRTIAAVFILLVGFGPASADEFFGNILKIDGNKITVMPFPAPLKKGDLPRLPAAVTLTAAEFCKVYKWGRLNPKTKNFEGGEPVEDGLKHPLFKNAIVSAHVVTVGNKVTEVSINGTPDLQFLAVLKKIDGKKVTFTTVFQKQGEEATLTVAVGLKVMEVKLNKETGKSEATPLEGGLKNPAFARAYVRVQIVLDIDNNITEIRLLSDLPMPPKRRM